ncbi:MAG TPA: tetratricopeptide repeat protein [Candidatus Cryosericum sp.]|nr:tetratricopeptide repeat protein [Candidatus Cryosericum sp.]
MGLLAWAGLSFRRVESAGGYVVADWRLLPLPARLVEPGRRFLPRGLCRLATYPQSPARLRVELTGDGAAHSREGSKVDLEAILAYSIPEDRVLDLHRSHGPSYASDWLAGLLRSATASRVAAVSYDVVRNRDPELPQSIRGEVSGAVATAGIVVSSVRLVQVSGLGESSGTILKAGVEPLDTKVLVVGVDSYTWRIAEPLMQQGRMPHLRSLVARGARANLRTINPILSPVIWTSIATGMKPSRHGIVDFVVTARDTGQLIPVTSRMRRVPALWTLLSRQDVDVDVVAWWATWPAETVRGRLVTDRVAFQLFEEAQGDWKSSDPARNRGKTYPEDLFETIRPHIQSPSETADAAIASFLPGGRVPFDLTTEQRDLLRQFRTVLAAERTYHAIAKELLRGPGRGLKMFYYEGPDTTSHLFMRFRPPRLPGVEPRDLELFGQMVDRYYELQDRDLGDLLAAAGQETDVILVSDHGFKSDSNRPLDSDSRVDRGKAAEWHTPVGVLAMAGPHIRSGIDVGAASVLDIAPTILALFGLPVARDMDGQPLTEALTPEFLAAHPVSWIDSYGGARAVDEEETLVASAGDAEVIEKLRSIGYIGEERMTAQNNRGLIALDEGDVDGAIAQFEHALAKGAPGQEVRLNLARAFLEKGDYEKARSAAAEVLRADPRSKQAEAIIAGTYIKEGRLEEAEARLRAALAIDASFLLARAKLGEVLQRQGRDDEALKELETAVSIAPLSPIEFNNIGNIHRRHGRIDQAMLAYRDALRADPQYIGAYNNLGLCLQEGGRLKEAAALYEKALAIRPENAVLRNSLATLRALQGDREGALLEVRRAVKSNPDWPVAQGNLATLLFQMGRMAEARGEFERWVAIEPDNLEARLGSALTLLATQEPEAAMARFEEVLKRDPGNFRANVALGEILLRRGELEKAQARLETAAKSGEPVPRVFNSLGEVYMKRGLAAEAASAFQRSLAIDPKQKEIRDRLAASRR